MCTCGSVSHIYFLTSQSIFDLTDIHIYISCLNVVCYVCSCTNLYGVQNQLCPESDLSIQEKVEPAWKRSLKHLFVILLAIYASIDCEVAPLHDRGHHPGVVGLNWQRWEKLSSFHEFQLLFSNCPFKFK